MPDIGTIIVTSAFGILDRLFGYWIEKKIQRVRLSDIEKEILQASRAEAERQRLRVNDLENEVKKLLDVLIVRIPQLEIKKTVFHKELHLEYNPQDEESTKIFLNSISERFKELYAECIPVVGVSSSPKDVLKNANEPAIESPQQVDLFIPVSKNLDLTDEATQKKGSYSSPWLQELQRRLEESEDLRK